MNRASVVLLLRFADGLRPLMDTKTNCIAIVKITIDM